MGYYILGLIAECSGKTQEAIKIFEKTTNWVKFNLKIKKKINKK